MSQRFVAKRLFRTGLVVGAGLWLLAASGTASETDYEQALSRTEDVAAALQSYDVSGTLLLANSVKGEVEGMSLDATFEVAGRWPDRLLNVQSSPAFNLHLGSGAAGAWFYLSEANAVYRGGPATLTRDLATAGDFELDPDRIYNFLAGLGSLLLPGGLTVSEPVVNDTLTVDGRDIACRRIRSEPETEVGARGVRQGPRTFWFDPVSGLCLRAEDAVYGNRNGVEMEQTATYVVTGFAMNGDVDEERFVYDTPAGVRVADSFEQLLNPNSLVGQPAPEITFTGLDGATFKLSDFRGQVVFLDIWATWCGPCRMEMPHIETLYRELGGSGDIVFLAASSEDKGVITAWLKKMPYTFPVATIPAGVVQSKLKASTIPTGFVIDRDGTIRAHLVGAQPETALRRALAKAGIGD